MKTITLKKVLGYAISALGFIFVLGIAESSDLGMLSVRDLFIFLVMAFLTICLGVTIVKMEHEVERKKAERRRYRAYIREREEQEYQEGYRLVKLEFLADDEAAV